MDYGFIKTAVAVPEVKVGDCAFNVARMAESIRQAAQAGTELLCFPELSISAYTCGDLFFQQCLLDEAEKAMCDLLHFSSEWNPMVIVGCPVRVGDRLFNTAVVFQKGNILGIVPKTYLPNNHESSEKRWFSSGEDVRECNVSFCGQMASFGRNLLFRNGDVRIAIELCEDLWAPIPPSCRHALAGANIIVNLSADNDLSGKHRYLRQLILQQSARCVCAYLCASAGFGESSTDLFFGGNAFIAENGNMIQEAERFCFEPQLLMNDIDTERLIGERWHNTAFKEAAGSFEIPPYTEIAFEREKCRDLELTRSIHPHPFVPSQDEHRQEHCEEIFAIQMGGLAKRIRHIGCPKLLVGISGGLDSTLALLVCVKTFDKLGLDRKGIVGITMPGFGTSRRTHNNALSLMESLGVDTLEIDIKASCEQHFKDIGHDLSLHDVCYENTQARERTQILMDYANKINAIVIGTGDLSELALGWATYNGDHMSMYGVNAGIPKTLISCMVAWIAETQIDEISKNILVDILRTPVSPELLPTNEKGEIAQKTEDLVGPYELHDFFLYYMIRFGFSPSKILFLATAAFKGVYEKAFIEKWLKIFIKRFFQQQFKRSCLPDGPKVGSVSLSPRGDWRMPSDAVYTAWLESLKTEENTQE